MKTELLVGDQWKWFEDEAEIRANHWHINHDDIVIDVGCHIGSYTLPALEAGATVYAIDPYIKFTSVLSLLAEDTSKLTIINATMAEDEGYTEEYQRAMRSEPNWHMHAKRNTTYITLDALVERYAIKKLDWLKIDVEGAELFVLRGGIKTLTRFNPKIVLEDHTGVYKFASTLQIGEQCRSLLISLDYQMKEIHYKGKSLDSLDRTFVIAERSEVSILQETPVLTSLILTN